MKPTQRTQALAGQVVDEYLHISLAESDDPEKDLLDVRSPSSAPVDHSAETSNLLVRIIGPIMAGMMVFYAFYTGTSTAQSILKEEEERTLPRLFTTPTSQATILTGKFLAVFVTVLVQIIVLIIVSHLIFGISWGEFGPVALVAAGTIFSASSFGIFVNSFLKDHQAGRGGLWRRIDGDRHDRHDQYLCLGLALRRPTGRYGFIAGASRLGSARFTAGDERASR